MQRGAQLIVPFLDNWLEQEMVLAEESRDIPK